MLPKIRQKMPVGNTFWVPVYPTICSQSGEDDFTQRSREMASFFIYCDYPKRIIERSLERVSTLPRAQVLQATMLERSTNQPTIPLVLTYHPLNLMIKCIVRASYKLLKDDPDTSNIFQFFPAIFVPNDVLVTVVLTGILCVPP